MGRSLVRARPGLDKILLAATVRIQCVAGFVLGGAARDLEAADGGESRKKLNRSSILSRHSCWHSSTTEDEKRHVEAKRDIPRQTDPRFIKGISPPDGRRNDVHFQGRFESLHSGLPFGRLRRGLRMLRVTKNLNVNQPLIKTMIHRILSLAML